ncbi:MAG: hypothetical protein MJ123_10210 [Lachnospiraceae bacterium]|nr:hypothetical protein [Lachnospiraceae bacterium]
MNVESLIMAIDGIDESMISDAITYEKTRKRRKRCYAILQYVAAAAVLAGIVFGTTNILKVLNRDNIEYYETPAAGQGAINATVVEIREGKIAVECLETFTGEDLNDKRLLVSLDTLSDEKVPDMKVGDRIRVLYIGGIKEADGELQIGKTISIFLLNSKGEVIDIGKK